MLHFLLTLTERRFASRECFECPQALKRQAQRSEQRVVRAHVHQGCRVQARQRELQLLAAGKELSAAQRVRGQCYNTVARLQALRQTRPGQKKLPRESHFKDTALRHGERLCVSIQFTCRVFFSSFLRARLVRFFNKLSNQVTLHQRYNSSFNNITVMHNTCCIHLHRWVENGSIDVMLLLLLDCLLGEKSAVYGQEDFTKFLPFAKIHDLRFWSQESGETTPINLQKLLTPASDSHEMLQSKNSKRHIIENGNFLRVESAFRGIFSGRPSVVSIFAPTGGF